MTEEEWVATEKIQTSKNKTMTQTTLELTENLNVTHYQNGDVIPQVTDPTEWSNLTTGAWCWYDNNPANEEAYGKLYNWYAVNDPRGLAPTGYHIPTDAEWDSLKLDAVYGGDRSSDGTFNYIGDNGFWWSSTEFLSTTAWYRFLFFSSSFVYRFNYTKRLGFSVRCVRDVEIQTDISDSTTTDQIDGIIFDLPFDDKIKLWELIDKLVLESKTN